MNRILGTMYYDILIQVAEFLENKEIPKTGVRFVKNGKGVGILVGRTYSQDLYEFSIYTKENVTMEFKCPITFDESDKCYDIRTEIIPANLGEMALKITNIINELLSEYDIDMKKYLAKERLEDE